MKNQTLKWILISLVIIVVLIALYFLWKSQQPTPPVQQGTQPTPSTGGALGGILGEIFNSGWINNLFGGGIKGGSGQTTNNSGYTTIGNCVNGCDDGNPGHDCDGFLSTNCGG